MTVSTPKPLQREKDRLETAKMMGACLDPITLEMVYPTGQRFAIERYFADEKIGGTK